MLVVADSSPLIALINIRHIDLLPELFREVIIPPEVAEELRRANRPHAVREWLAVRPAWLVERAPTRTEPIPALHPGELAAISLAAEAKADLLLIDEMHGRKAAAARGRLDLSDAFARIKATDFWISHDLLDERLALYLATRNARAPRQD